MIRDSQKFDDDIAKIKKRLKALTPIPPKQVKIQVISKRDFQRAFLV